MLDVRTEHTAEAVEVLEVGELADVLTATLVDRGLDRMTASRVEELLTPVALTAHL